MVHGARDKALMFYICKATKRYSMHADLRSCTKEKYWIKEILYMNIIKIYKCRIDAGTL